MDDDTVLLVFGDHGMNNAGGHGGGSEQELSTIFFAHTKNPAGFPMKQKPKQIQDIFDKLSRNIKQLDVPSMMAALLDTLIPFQSVGVLVPSIFPTSNMVDLLKRMILNVQQLENHMNEKCKESD